MANRYKVISGGPYPHLVTCTIIRWQPVFLSQLYFEIITESLQHLRANRGLAMHAYVVMPTHVHAVLTARDDDLQDLMRDFKRFTSRAISHAAEQDGNKLLTWLFRDAAKSDPRSASKVWQDEYHPKALMTSDAVTQKIEYVHANPVRKAMVVEPRHWCYSSAAAYEGELDVPLEVDFAEW